MRVGLQPTEQQVHVRGDTTQSCVARLKAAGHVGRSLHLVRVGGRDQGAQGGNVAAQNMAESLAAAAEPTPWAEARHDGAGRRSRQHTKSGGNPGSTSAESRVRGDLAASP